jgi:MoxR-like ATPase
MLWGGPGVGKSQLVAQLARRREAKLRDVRLSQKTASDIGGLPALDHQKKQTIFYLPDFLPREDEPGILFLDELPGADEQTRIAAYGLILERRVANWMLGDRWRIIAAGNRPEDGAISCDLGTAMNDDRGSGSQKSGRTASANVSAKSSSAGWSATRPRMSF